MDLKTRRRDSDIDLGLEVADFVQLDRQGISACLYPRDRWVMAQSNDG